MPSEQAVGSRRETRIYIALPRGAKGWPVLAYVVFVATIAVSAACMALFPIILPFIEVGGRVLTACVVALLYDQITHFNPFDILQLIDPSRSSPADVLAKWIYLPVLGAISLLLTLPAFSLRVEEPSGRHAVAAAAALASLLYVVLLLAYPIDNLIAGQCLCANPTGSVYSAFAALRWGYYLTLALALYNLLANVILTSAEPFQKWIGRSQSSWVDPLCITSVFPADCAEGVGARPEVKAIFNRKLNSSTIMPSTFTLLDSNGVKVKGRPTYEGSWSSARYELDQDLKPGTTYTAWIKGTVKDAEGHQLGKDYTWSFCTAAAPALVKVIPTRGATKVPITTLVTACFSEPIDPKTVNDNTYYLRRVRATANEAGAYFPLMQGEVVTLEAALAHGTTYKVTVIGRDKGVKSQAGFQLAADCYEWTFTTADRHVEHEKCEHCPARDYKAPCPKRVDGQCTEPASTTPAGDAEQQTKPTDQTERESRSERDNTSPPVQPIKEATPQLQEPLSSHEESLSMPLRLRAAAKTDLGLLRKGNEDDFYFLIADAPRQATGLFIVADGIGGYQAGEIASSLAVGTIRDELQPLLTQTEQPSAGLEQHYTTKLREAVERAHEVIVRYGRDHTSASDLGSTLTAALVMDGTAYIANVGDSRTYLLRGGKLQQVTRDHSKVAELVEAGQIKPEDVYDHPERNVVLRSLGAGRPEVKVDIFCETLQVGDALLLCSDGLWEMVHDPEITSILNDAPDPEAACELLIDRANAHGGRDNITAVVVRCEKG
jgi:protein phosphatase